MSRTDTIRLYQESGKFCRWISVDQANTLVATGDAVAIHDPDTGAYLGLQLWSRDEPLVTQTSNDGPTPSSLTCSDMVRNAAGSVDTSKRSELYRLRRENQVVVPAAVRCYGLNAQHKPDESIVGNSVDRSMTRVEYWGEASSSNKAVTVAAGRVVVHCTHLDLS